MLSISGNICVIVWSMGTNYGHEVFELSNWEVNVSFSYYWDRNHGKLIAVRRLYPLGGWPRKLNTQATARRCVSPSPATIVGRQHPKRDAQNFYNNFLDDNNPPTIF